MLTNPLTFPLDYAHSGETANNPASVAKLTQRLLSIADTPLSNEDKTFLIDCAKDMATNSVEYRASPHKAYLEFLLRHIPVTQRQSDLLEIFSSIYLVQRRIGEHSHLPQSSLREDPVLSQATIDAISNLCKVTDGLAIMLARTPELEQQIARLQPSEDVSKDAIAAEIEYQQSVLKAIGQAKGMLVTAFDDLSADYMSKKAKLTDDYRAQFQAIVNSHRATFASDNADTDMNADGDVPEPSEVSGSKSE